MVTKALTGRKEHEGDRERDGRMAARPEAGDVGRRGGLRGLRRRPPVVLVHGTPTRSYLWRNIVPALAEHRSVYVYDLLGYGESEKGEGQDVSIAAQARVLKELVEAWGLEEPAIAGHDMGGGIVLRAQLLEGVRFSRVAILDAVVLGPRLSEPRSSTWHVREHAEAYEAMPNHLFGAFFSAYLGETNSNLGRDT